MPDGSVRGPAEYFKEKEIQFLNWIDSIETNLTTTLKNLIEASKTSLLPYNNKLTSLKQADELNQDEPCNYCFAFVPKNASIDIKLHISVNKLLSIDTYNNVLTYLNQNIRF